MLVYSLGAKITADVTGAGPVRARGVREVWGAAADGVCVSAYLCAHRWLRVNAVRKEEEEEERALLAGGSKSNEKFS